MTDDINGPIILCFSASTPITLACDAAGKVFASPLLEVVGDDLSAAEPADVKQVWVATKIHGCEKWSFKSHHGKYLGCDKHGILSATREAISPEEEFIPVRNELGGGRWALQTVRERFVGVDERGGVIEVRGDAESVGFGETWRLRLQKRNKKKTKGIGADGKIRDKITRKELEELAGVKLDDDQVKTLKRSRKGMLESSPTYRVPLANEVVQRAAFTKLCWISGSSMENTTNLHIEISHYYLVH